MVLVDRFYPVAELFEWLHRHGWHYRLRLKSNLGVEPEFGDLVTTGELAAEFVERHLPNVRWFASGVSTNLGILHEAGHDEPWIIAMNETPTRQPCGIMAAGGVSSQGNRMKEAADFS